MKPYDIFISYRRSSYDTANLIATRLKAAGYSVFFDMETLRAGKFNEQLYNVIDNCKDFVLVLPPNALGRCVNEDDWVRLEVCRAMAAKKNIVPVMLNGFTWSDPMPAGMEELSYYHALTASSVEFFDLAMERLQQKYLTSKRHLPVKRAMTISLIVLVSVAALVLIGWAVFMGLSKGVCTKYATSLTNDASYIHLMAEENQSLKKDWDEFDRSFDYESSHGRLVYMQENMLARIDLAESNLKQIWKVDSLNLEIGPYHTFLLSLHGINAEEIAVSPQFATLYYTDYLDQLQTIRDAVITPNTMKRRFVNVLFEVLDHSINSYYASVLCELAPFPKKSLTSFNEYSEHWKYFPQEYKTGEEREYYDGLINKESELAEEALSRYKSMLEKQDAELEDLQRNNDKLDAIADQVVQVFNDNNQELAIRREKVKAKEQILEATKSELDELDKEYIQAYETLKAKCLLEEDDDQWYQWGKIRRWGTYLNMLVESRRNLREMGVYSTSKITPEVAYADMASFLQVYQTYHPEAAPYVASAKQFYRDLSKDKRDYAGVIIFAFKDDAVHPFFKAGDIVVAYDNKKIKSYSDFKAAFKENAEGVVRYLRLTDGQLEEFENKLEASDIVGFLDLTE